MCSHDNYVSPYLLRPLRTYEEIKRADAWRTETDIRSKARTETAAHEPGHEASDDVTPTR